MATKRKKGSNANIKLFAKKKEESNPLILSMKEYDSGQINDPFSKLYGVSDVDSELKIEEPTFSLDHLCRLPNENNTLKQCIEAMVTNIEGFGYTLEYIGQEGQEESEPSMNEFKRIEELLENPNGDYSLTDLRERVRKDYECTGNAYIEISRDQKGNIVSFYHIPSQTMRITRKDKEPVTVTRKLLRNGEVVSKAETKWFRRYVQKIGNKKVYFKEYSDPRPINPQTGKVDEAIGFEDQATEVIHLGLYNPGHVYGMPRWVNQLPSILGSRESELTNLQFFRDNAIPALAIMVSGGQLTETTESNIRDYFHRVTGRDASNRVIVLEASGDDSAASEDGKIPSPKLQIEPLSAHRQSDELFQTYDDNNRKKVQSSFRLPDILVGRSTDINRATAEAALDMAEGQVFAPERKKIDDIFNYKLLTDIDGVPGRYWQFKSNPLRVSSHESIVSALTNIDSIGGATPNVGRTVLNKIFDLDLPRIEEDWGNYPFAIVRDLATAGKLKGMAEIINDKSFEAQVLPDEDADPKEDPKVTEDQQGQEGIVEDVEEKKLTRKMKPRKRIKK